MTQKVISKDIKLYLLSKALFKEIKFTIKKPFTSILKNDSLQIVFALVPHWILEHQDVKTVFLNGDLEKEVYMDQ